MLDPHIIFNPAKRAAKSLLRATLYRDAVFVPKKEDRPLMVRLDINNTCNQGCIKCFYPDYAKSGAPTHFMAVEEFDTLAQRVFDYTYFLQMSCSFEGMAHPKLPELIRIIERHKIPIVGMITNGSLLRGEKAEAIARAESFKIVGFSMDSVDPEIYAKMRGRAHLGQVQENILALQALRATLGRPYPKLKINALVSRTSLAGLPALLGWVLEHDLDEIEFMHVGPIEPANEESLINAPAEYEAVYHELGRMARGRRLKMYLPLPFSVEHGTLDPQSKQYAQRLCQDVARSEYDSSLSDQVPDDSGDPYPRGLFCICPWMTLVLDCWGNVYPCGHRVLEPPIGNILRQPLDAVINSMRNLKLRRALLDHKLEGICASCVARTPGSDPMRRRATRDLPEGE
jgi:radical SAM protein with 4Fe4S-binding SPASM domain